MTCGTTVDIPVRDSFPVPGPPRSHLVPSLGAYRVPEGSAKKCLASHAFPLFDGRTRSVEKDCSGDQKGVAWLCSPTLELLELYSLVNRCFLRKPSRSSSLVTFHLFPIFYFPIWDSTYP
ncbi:hypothetical protein VTK73DRAFT_7948 [Phialemonium thermophilum]|uniref:Uncharacterized protein n=1 Tax=Phialemonium thermophilum TaxID=223376 RepID=A0ABR3XS42_9PEZI